jgi:hypothetical protein
MTAFVETFAIEVAATVAVGAVMGFVYGLTTREPARRSSRCSHCGTTSQDGARLRRAA